MDIEMALNIAKRFVTMPLEKRKTYLQRMHAENISPANLPLPAVKLFFDRTPLSYAQQRQWFLWQLEPESTAYNMPTALRFKGPLDIDALRSSFESLIARHETLRTTFCQEDEQAVQVIHPAVPFELVVEGLQVSADIDLNHVLKTEVEAEVQRAFDLEQGPLLRVKLLRLSEEDHVLVLTLHHIVSDGWSMPIMIDELVQLYEGYRVGEVVSLPELSIQYADYAIWQRQWMEAGERERQLVYWKEQLGDEQPVLELPLDRPRPSVQSYAGANLEITLDEPLAHSLKQLAKEQGSTLFMLLLASFQTLLHRYSGQSDIRVGVPIANRNRVETERLIGFFVNTQVLKAEFDLNTTFSALLKQVQQAALDAQAHQDLPFEQLVEALQPERSLSHSPLFQVMYNHQSQVRGNSQALSGLTVESLFTEQSTAKFDLTLDTYEYANGIGASLCYATDLFDKASIERLSGHWINLLNGIVKAPQQWVSELPLLSEQEHQQIVCDWNRTRASYPNDQCIHQLIEAQADKTPNAIAVVFDNQELTYQQLNGKANQLAHKLREQGVGPDVLVGIAVERSLEMVVGLLGVLKAGGAYVPLDPEYPEDRLAYMMEDSGIALLLTQAHLQAQLPIPDHVHCLMLDEGLKGYSDTNPINLTQPDNLAYVIYTSGSTGKPKGTLLPHQNVMRLFAATQDWYQFDANDVWSVFHSYAFDFSVWELFGALLYGAKAVVVPKDVARSPEDFHNLLLKQKVTVLNQTPSAFKQLIPIAVDKAQPLSLRYVVFGGEALDVSSLAPWFDAFGDRQPQLVNMYGITETTVHVTYRPISREDLSKEGVSPIGEVIPDLSWYLLDSNLGVAAPGCQGELHVGRAGLARGYHQRADLTALRFIPDPFDTSEQGGGRLYRTGDLARYRADGVIEYAGRIDHQVKIRGFRIELGEIEAQLQAYESVRDVVVIDIEGPNGKQLVGYLVAEVGKAEHSEQQTLLRAALRDHLKANLPDYMVPTHLLFLEKMPLTPNGKLDRKALPKPGASQLHQEYVAPQSELEQQIAAIWADVLKVDKVGLTDNFFELGGDSIISIQVVSRARQMGIRFTPKELFQHQTVQGLASVAKRGEAGALQIDQGPVIGEGMLLPIHQYFFDEAIPERHHWNQALLLKPGQVLEPELIDQALQALIVHHDALRLNFKQDSAGNWFANYRPVAEQQEVLWQSSVNSESELEALCSEAQSSLGLQDGPLIRAVLATLTDGTQRLLLAIHHLAVDGVSWRILLEDLQTAYGQLQEKQAIKLPEKTSSTRVWAEHLQTYASSEALQQELGYWKDQLADINACLPCDNTEGSLQGRHAGGAQTRLDQNYTRQLLQDAPSAYRTQINDLLLTTLARVISRWTQQDNVLVQLEGHGREELFDTVDLTRTVGWFTSMFPVKLSPSETLAGSIKQIKEQLRAIPNKGIGFGALRYLSDEASQQTLAELPVPRITFNYLGQFDSSFEGEAEEAAFLAPANESSGTSQSEEAPLGNWLSINGQVYSGELSLSWSFSREMFDETTVQKLASEYAEELKALIEHCSNEATSGLTPSDVPLARLSQEQLDALPISANEIEDIYPLSPMQQGMLFHSLFEQGGGDYINQVRVDVDGLDVERFHQAWQAVVDRHEVLRASFVTQFEQPLQVIRKQVAMPFVVLDWSTQADLAQNLDTWAEADRHKGFDLQQEPLLRIAAIRTGENSHHLIYTNHHILMDGWSNSQLLGEVLQSYAGDPLAHQASRYRDYIEWLQKQDKVQSEAFWRGQFGDLQEPTHLAQAIRQDKETLGQGYGDHYQVLDKKRTQALSDFARQQRVTVNTLVQAAWLLLLQRYTGQDTVAFGATVSGRPAELKGVEQQLGLFINTLPVIASPKPEQSVAQWIEQVQAQNLALREHEHTPLYDVQRWAGQGGEALFDNILVFENYPVSEALQQGASEEISFGEVANHEQTNYPLTLAVGLGEELSVHYSYDRSNFDDSAIERVAKHFDNLLGEITKQSQQHLGDLALLDAAEHQQIVYDWNRTEENYPSDQCIHQLIEARVDKTSDAIAVVFDNQELTYQQLNGKANQLAHKLRQLGVGPDVLVGIAVERSLEMVVGLLGILKAGGAYVPLDPEYPADRLAYMMEDSGIALLLTEAHLQAQLPIPDHVHCLMLDEDLKGYSDTNPINLTQPDNLAYVMYTSGSTGRPKGVAISHDALSQHAHVSLGFFNLSGDDRILQFATFNFDGFVEQLYPALICGASVVIRGRDIWDSETFYQELLARDISVVDVTTAYWFMLAKDFAEKGPRDYGRLHQFHSGGEAMPPEGVAAWKKAGLEHVHLLNTYGPTEATVTVSTHDCIDYLSGKEPLPALMPIGKVLPGRTIYLLDHFGKIVVNGAIGELTIGGELLARGYFNRPALTAERFIPDPFDTSEQGGGRLYRTGDLTRYLDDGVIEFVGRIDHQVKIRGFRIELGEIEAQLQAHEAVREAVVIDIEGLSGKQLVGYLVAAAGQAGDSEQQKLLRTSLRDHLRGNLPDYMVPAHLVFLEKMPLTPNGKLDRKALPKPDTSQLQQEYVAPQSELEQQIAAIWADVLKVEKVGLTDNFFELGGHSLLATQVISRVNHEWNLSVPLKALFVSENLGGFSVQVETLHAGAHSLGSELAKSLGDLKRLSLNELEQLIS